MVTRRGFLKGAAGTLAVGSIAGCLGSGDEEPAPARKPSRRSGQTYAGWFNGEGNTGDTHIRIEPDSIRFGSGRVSSAVVGPRAGMTGDYLEVELTNTTADYLEVAIRCTFYENTTQLFGPNLTTVGDYTWHYEQFSPGGTSHPKFFYNDDETIHLRPEDFDFFEIAWGADPVA